MSKVSETSAVIKAACQRAQELGFVNSITPGIVPEVHMMYLRHILRLPGRLLLKKWGVPEPQCEASKTVDGVRFLCLITEEQYEELKAS